MKIIIQSLVVFAMTWLVPPMTEAQGTLAYLSNLGQSSLGTEPIGSDSWMSSGFSTGTNAGGYMLDSIQLALAAASGNPSGFAVMLYSSVPVSGGTLDSPGIDLATLSGPGDPAAGGVFSYAPDSGCMLSADTSYYIVLATGTKVANGAYGWNWAGGDGSSYNPSGGWMAPPFDIAGDNYQSKNGSSWTLLGSVNFEFAVTANSVPEPGALGLGALGGLLSTWRCWKARARQS